ncbi:hypothetical protein [Rhodococcus sp. HNM0569]|uniref:hypothetical protein n=1 Tax=Rhodococcus sp. HNM0569 TaxID=2716340 RepID=UPI00146A58FB|nr:hypothetical protein [Rhodococcus sp. HNM0569]NLU84721.1 hypothetical protein [Rhodococcus sp. HNM0569]
MAGPNGQRGSQQPAPSLEAPDDSSFCAEPGGLENYDEDNADQESHSTPYQPHPKQFFDGFSDLPIHSPVLVSGHSRSSLIIIVEQVHQAECRVDIYVADGGDKGRPAEQPDGTGRYRPLSSPGSSERTYVDADRAASEQ